MAMFFKAFAQIFEELLVLEIEIPCVFRQISKQVENTLLVAKVAEPFFAFTEESQVFENLDEHIR